MRTFATFALIIITMSLMHDAKAQGKYYPWCARYNGWTIVCGFDTFRQCQATISGVGGICQENVMPPPLAEMRTSHKRKYRRAY